MKVLIYDFKKKYTDKWEMKQMYELDMSKSYKLSVGTVTANQNIVFTDSNVLEVEVEGIDERDKKNWSFKVNIKTGLKNREISVTLKRRSQGMVMGSCDKVPHINIGVPKEAMIDAIIADSTSGNIDLKDCSDFEILSAHTLSGHINIDSLNGKFSDNIKIDSTSGNINIAKSIMHKVEINTLSGNISLKDVEIDACKLDVTSGKIALRDVSIYDTIIESLSGDVDIYRLKGKKTKINTTSSNVITQDLFSDIIEIDSMSGSIYIDTSSNPNFRPSVLDVTTFSGKYIKN